jgi:hypothetical protein
MPTITKLTHRYTGSGGPPGAAQGGLVDERREGTRHLFVVNPGGFSAVQEFLADFWTEHLGRPVPGGAFEIDINGVPVRGHYLEIDPPRRVLVSWASLHPAGWQHFLARLTQAAAGQDPGPDPWDQAAGPEPGAA